MKRIESIRYLPTLLAVATTVLAGYMFVHKAQAWGFIDVPDPRKIHTMPTPRTGGLAMVAGGSMVLVLSVALGWLPWPALPWQTWLAGFGFITVGALDDRYSFHPRQKFLVLLGLSALATWPWLLVIKVTGIPWLPKTWFGSPALHTCTALLLTFWFMAVPNAVNIEDAINGYMGGFTIVVLSGLLLRGVDTRIALGALLGFLFLNWPKAKHFMGDAGSFGCGFFIAEAILRGGGLAQPIMALAFTAPVSMDVTMGLIRRQRLGMTFFTADRATFPHHLLNALGGNPLIASPILWTNALLFLLTSDSTSMVVGYTIFFATVLIILNRNQLFGPSIPQVQRK